jgi:hypothetical protein
MVLFPPKMHSDRGAANAAAQHVFRPIAHTVDGSNGDAPLEPASRTREARERSALTISALATLSDEFHEFRHRNGPASMDWGNGGDIQF